MGFTGGFDEARLASDTFRVEFKGNGFTPRSKVEISLLYRRALERWAHHVQRVMAKKSQN